MELYKEFIYVTNLNLRQVESKDLPALLPLFAQLGYPTSEQALNERFIRFVQNPGYGVIVAVLDDQTVGLVAWSRSHRLISDVTRLHIEALVVDAAFRNQGIGKRLINFVEEIALTLSPSLVDLTSGLRRAKDGIHDFYKNLGYKNEGHMAKLYLRKELYE